MKILIRFILITSLFIGYYKSDCQVIDSIKWSQGLFFTGSKCYPKNLKYGDAYNLKLSPGNSFSIDYRVERKLGIYLKLETGLKYSNLNYYTGSFIYGDYVYAGHSSVPPYNPKSQYVLITTSELKNISHQFSIPILLSYTSINRKIKYSATAGIITGVSISDCLEYDSTIGNYTKPDPFFYGNYDVEFLYGYILKLGIEYPLNDKYLISLKQSNEFTKNHEYIIDNYWNSFHFLNRLYSPGFEIGITRKIQNKRFSDKTYSKTDSITQKRKNYLYFEAGGNGEVYSLNYERSQRIKSWLSIYERIGYSFYGLKDFEIPVGVSIAISPLTSKMEIGTGLTYIYYEWEGVNRELRFVPYGGYRLETRKNNIYRVTFTPYLPLFKDDSFWGAMGISYGRRF